MGLERPRPILLGRRRCDSKATKMDRISDKEHVETEVDGAGDLFPHPLVGGRRAEVVAWGGEQGWRKVTDYFPF